MAVTTHTISGDLHDLIGGDLDGGSVHGFRPSAVHVVVESNIPDDSKAVLVAGGEVRLGDARVEVQSDATFSQAGFVASDSEDTNVDSETPLLYRVRVEYPRSSDGKRKTWWSPWFELTEDTDVADAVETAFVPASLKSDAIDAIESAKDTAVGAVEDAAESTLTPYVTAAESAQAAAEAAQAAAETARDEAVDLSNIDTSDGLVKALIEDTGSETAGALSALFAVLDNPTEHAPGFGLFFPEAEGAVGDGTTNDRAAVQAAIDAASAAGGGRVIGTAGATYGVSTTVNLKSGVTLENVRFKDLVGNLNIVNISGVSDFTIRGCHFTGSGTVGTTGRGAIYGPDNLGAPTRGKIVGNTFDTLGTCGIAVEATDLIIQGNHFRNTAEHGIYVSDGSSGVVVADNIIEGAGTGGTTNPVNGIKVANCSEVHLRNNIVRDCLSGGAGVGNGILFDRGAVDCSAVGNVVHDNTGFGIRIVDQVAEGPCVRIHIWNNIVYGNADIGIRFSGGGTDCTVIGNTVRTNDPIGIYASGSTLTNLTIDRNIVLQTGTTNAGIAGVFVGGATIRGNRVRVGGSQDCITIQATSAGVRVTADNDAPKVTNGAGAGAVIENRIGNSATAATLGTVVRKIQAFDASGTSLGWVPVYDAIT